MERNVPHDPVDSVEEEADLGERATIAQKNIPFLDDEAAKVTAADQLHPGKINPSSRSVDDERARKAQADDTN